MQFDTPSPQSRTGHDYSANPIKDAPVIEYKTGKLEEASVKMYFDGKMGPEYLTQGFNYYDKAQSARVNIPTFTAYVLGVYAGSFSNGKERGDIRYYSNLVNDTRTDIVQSFFFVDSKVRTFAIGNYKTDIVPAFEALVPKRGSTYTKVLVVYIAERKEVCAIHLNATAEAGLCKAIAKARGVEEWKGSLFGLCDLSSEVWVFQFNGESEPVVFASKDAKKTPATLPADKTAKVLYFQPIFNAGVLKLENQAYTERVRSINAMQNELSEYIASEQAHLSAMLSGAAKPVDSAREAAEQAERELAFATPSELQSAIHGTLRDREQLAAHQIGQSKGQTGIPTPVRNYEPFPDAPPPTEMAGAFENVEYPDDWNN